MISAARGTPLAADLICKGEVQAEADRRSTDRGIQAFGQALYQKALHWAGSPRDALAHKLKHDRREI